MPFYAHTKTHSDGTPAPPEQWEPLFTPWHDHPSHDPATACSGQDAAHCPHCKTLAPTHGHLNKVASLCATFAGDMFPPGPTRESVRQWGYLAGLWHDLGKFAPNWQSYLKSKVDPHIGEITNKVDHSSAGAQYANQDCNIHLFGRLLAYPIAGHHAGLANGIDDTGSCLETRLKKSISEFQPTVPRQLLSDASLPPISFALESGHSLASFLRMLFSCLVDADFLATESFMASDKRDVRSQTNLPDIAQMVQTLRKHLADFGPPETPVNHLRAEILSHCLAAAKQDPGIFSLTVPTGGGKTLSSLAFALEHARRHNLRRVIYVIPYTSIIEQNAEVFRKALASLGPDVVLEHHCNLDPDSEKQTERSRLASENWDARLIVTTNVQFFESLHAHRTSRCRKLHRIARSVIILDEAQSLPVELLAPCLRSLEELTKNYHSTVVLCTATQPSIIRNSEFPIGISQPTEIIPNPKKLYNSLRRVSTVHLPDTLDHPSLTSRLAEHEQVLCIVNTRRHARQLFDLLPDDGTRRHLSALMCPEHRKMVLDEIKQRLDDGLPIRLVSTQLIEAGVDIDFPVVFRALAGLDSIAQAAGRCDREGLLTAAAGRPAGNLFIFHPETPAPPGFIRSTADSTAEILAPNPSDPLSLECIEEYFRTHYWKHSSETDKKHILECWPKSMTSLNDLLLFQFKTCGEDFRLIDDYSAAVIVPWNTEGTALCKQLRETFEPAEIRRLARKLQRHTVTIPRPQHTRLLDAGILLPLHDERFFLLNSDPHYSEKFGLHPEPNIDLPPETSII